MHSVDGAESLSGYSELMEAICTRENLKRALKRVRQNKGAPGVDGMTVDELATYLKAHWPDIKEQLYKGTYQPTGVKRVAVPKPGGRRAAARYTDGIG
jgi:RNA-directed DNA polymerase